ncbi:MAG: hypothetical protein U9R74_01085 [Pseudomonadota bacterium]|nr:hypothetical protein [Pseudomonadota bacterium]
MVHDKTGVVQHGWRSFAGSGCVINHTVADNLVFRIWTDMILHLVKALKNDTSGNVITLMSENAQPVAKADSRDATLLNGILARLLCAASF